MLYDVQNWIGGCLELQRIDKGKRWNDFSRSRLQPTIVGSGVLSENHELSLGSFFFSVGQPGARNLGNNPTPFTGLSTPTVTLLVYLRYVRWIILSNSNYRTISYPRAGRALSPGLTWFGGCSGRLIFHWPKL